MRLSTTLKFSPSYAGIEMDLVWEAERLGFDAVWAGEAYGSDAVSPVAWVLARTSRIKAGTSIMQMPARTPACAAMTALTLQALSGNRFLCGLGPSGPQVVEGWHGSRATPEQAAPIVARLREARSDPGFAVSLRYGWDGRDEGELRARLEGYAAVGVGHVLVEPAERELNDWLAAVERVAGAAEGMLS